MIVLHLFLLAVASATGFCQNTVTVTQTVTTTTTVTTCPASTVTITQTVTATQTAIRTVTTSYCPTSTAPPSCATSIKLTFDDISCSGICPFPSTYRRFAFDTASGWKVINRAALPTTENEDLAVNSLPNALLAGTSYPVHFGSTGQGLTFDVIRFLWSMFSTDNTSDIAFFLHGTTAAGEHRSYNTTLTSGIYIAPYLLDLTSPPGIAEGFFDLVDVSFAAYSQYNPVTNTGVPAVMIFDDMELVVHVGGVF